MPRIALGLEYDGSAFCRLAVAGARSRRSSRSSKRRCRSVADHPVEVTAAGRTDAGVHAAMQVVHFDTQAVRTERGWVLGATTNLPPQVSALWAREVPDAFHARYSALARTLPLCHPESHGRARRSRPTRVLGSRSAR